MLRRALLATLLVFATTPVLYAKELILLHRIGPSQSTLFIAKADGSDERPLRLNLKNGVREVVAIEDRWYSPGATYFRVLLDDGDRYVIRHEEAQDVWSLAGYRAGGSASVSS